jgi:hypothetical protein
METASAGKSVGSMGIPGRWYYDDLSSINSALLLMK